MKKLSGQRMKRARRRTRHLDQVRQRRRHRVHVLQRRQTVFTLVAIAKFSVEHVNSSILQKGGACG